MTDWNKVNNNQGFDEKCLDDLEMITANNLMNIFKAKESEIENKESI
jgi:hypothetical protein